MASSLSSKTITLKSNDGKLFVVSEAVALYSQNIRTTIEKIGTEKPILVQTTNTKILAKVIEYCNAAEASKTETSGEGGSTKASDNELEKWEQDVLEVDQCTLLGLIMAAYDMDISKLRNATRIKGDMMERNSPQDK